MLFRCDWNPILYAMPAAWTPDGKSIVLLLLTQTGGRFSTRLALIDVADGRVRELKSFDGRWSVGQATISPDGAYIAYARPAGTDMKRPAIVALSIADLQETVLVDSPATQPIWTGDGTAVLFLSDRRGATDLFRQRVNGGQPHDPPETLRTDVGDITLLGLSRNGILAYRSTANTTYAYTAPFDPATGHAGALVRVGQGAVAAEAPAWSPDGRTLAMIRRGPPRLVLHTTATGDEREFSLSLNGPTLWGWFPDGRSALVSGAYQGKQTFVRFFIDPPHGESFPPLGPYLTSARPTISADGETVFFAGLDSTQKGVAIVAADVPSGERREVLRTQLITGLALSSDGRQLAYVERTGGRPDILYTVDVNGGQPRKIAEFPPPMETWNALAWLPDGHHLLVAVHRGANAGKWEIDRIAVEGGARQATGISMENLFNGISVSSDGRQLAFAGGGSLREAWVMEHFLPGGKPR